MAVAVRVPAAAYPTQVAAAKMLGVSESTLSRRADVERISSGKAKHIPAREVLRLARDRYRERLISEVAFDLVQYAHEHSSGHADAVEHEVDQFLSELRTPDSERDQWLAQAKEYLPPELYAEAVAAVQAGAGAALGGLVGAGPDDD